MHQYQVLPFLKKPSGCLRTFNAFFSSYFSLALEQPQIVPSFFFFAPSWFLMSVAVHDNVRIGTRLHLISHQNYDV